MLRFLGFRGLGFGGSGEIDNLLPCGVYLGQEKSTTANA